MSSLFAVRDWQGSDECVAEVGSKAEADSREGISDLLGFVPLARQEPWLEEGEESKQSEMGEKVQDALGAEEDKPTERGGVVESPPSHPRLSFRTRKGLKG